jgi:tyrosyl-tRNA synthetase
MGEWFRLAADFDTDAVTRIEDGLASGEIHPNEAKRHLARSVVTLYWGEEEARAAEEAFDRVFKEGRTPENVEEFGLPPDDPIHLPSLIRDVFGMSGSEARRMIAQGAVRIDDEAVADQEVTRSALIGAVLRVGKRRFARLKG